MTVIIPAYNPPENLPERVAALTREGAAVLVVDDGSDKAYAPVFRALSENSAVTVLHRPRNGGKGRALKDAFLFCRKKYAENEIFVTADADGQHTVRDILRVGKRAALAPGALTLGVRDFDQKCVPARSKFGNLFTRRLFTFVTGVRIGDTQTGLRGFSGKLLPLLLSAGGERFSYETEVLCLAVRAGVRIGEVPIETVYDGSNRSHFRTVRDSASVLAALFRNIARFAVAGAISGAVDLALFYLISRAFSGVTEEVRYFVATAAARLASSAVNLALGAKFVFGKLPPRAVRRYYALWSVRLVASFAAAVGADYLVGGLPGVTLVKALFDLTLSLLTYGIEASWVFRADTERPAPGLYYRFAVSVLRLFCHVERIAPPDSPTVYLARHRGAKGPLLAVAALPVSVRPWVYFPFFHFGTAFTHYRDVTFRRLFFLRIPLAFFGALLVPPLLRSARAVPVYRGASTSEETVRLSAEALALGESLLLFPDVNYRSEERSPLYTGFLSLSARIGDVRYVPLVLEGRHLAASEPIFCEGGTREDALRVLGRISERLFEGI